MQAVVSISASPGLRSEPQRAARAAADAEAAGQLQNMGLQPFVEAWYSKPMWRSLRQHPWCVAVQYRIPLTHRHERACWKCPDWPHVASQTASMHVSKSAESIKMQLHSVRHEHGICTMLNPGAVCSFPELVQRRLVHGDSQGLAASLRGMSTGLQEQLWEALPGLACPILAVAGELDPKFMAIGQAMAAAVGHPHHESLGSSGEVMCAAIMSVPSCDGPGSEAANSSLVLLEQVAPRRAQSGPDAGFQSVRGCSHAVLTEAPLQLLAILRSFVTSVER